jgi:hypothetical protein
VGDTRSGIHARVLEQLWQNTLPDARVTRIEDAGHYLRRMPTN